MPVAISLSALVCLYMAESSGARVAAQIIQKSDRSSAMLEQIRTIDGENLLPLPADALADIGLQPGGQVEVTVVGQSFVVQLPYGPQLAESEFMELFQAVMQDRRDAYQKLA
jgi:antitoxin component of MazEF toxin-antitoxin module